MHPLRVEPLAPREYEQGFEYVAADARSTRVPGDPEAVSAAGDFDVEAALDLANVFVELAAEIGEPTVVGRLQDDVPGYVCGIQVELSTPCYSDVDRQPETTAFRRLVYTVNMTPVLPSAPIRPRPGCRSAARAGNWAVPR